MLTGDPALLPPCPDPLDRAARITPTGVSTMEWLRLAPPALQGALVALAGRNTTGHAMTSQQRMTHLPASPMVSISWFRGSEAGLLSRGDAGPAWQPFGSQVVVAGTQSSPTVTWAPNAGSGCMACFAADAAQELFGLDLAAIQDRVVPVDEVVSAAWKPLWDELLASSDDAVMTVLESHLARRWQGVQGRSSAKHSLRQLGQHWVQRLAWKAHEWRAVHSERHVERRIKSYSGRSLREWQALTRTESLFFAARDRYETGKPFDWAGLAVDEGFADQAHMSRVTKRITGFSPSEFANRFIEDESFWMFRLWV